jgi:hypothetical protein
MPKAYRALSASVGHDVAPRIRTAGRKAYDEDTGKEDDSPPHMLHVARTRTRPPYARPWQGVNCHGLVYPIAYGFTTAIRAARSRHRRACQDREPLRARLHERHGRPPPLRRREVERRREHTSRLLSSSRDHADAGHRRNGAHSGAQPSQTPVFPANRTVSAQASNPRAEVRSLPGPSPLSMRTPGGTPIAMRVAWSSEAGSGTRPRPLEADWSADAHWRALGARNWTRTATSLMADRRLQPRSPGAAPKSAPTGPVRPAALNRHPPGTRTWSLLTLHG